MGFEIFKVVPVKESMLLLIYNYVHSFLFGELKLAILVHGVLSESRR